MVRILFFVLFVGAAVAATLAFKTWTSAPGPRPEVAEELNDIVSLRDGTTLVAEKGTVGRDLVDWLDDRSGGQRSFELGGQEFVNRTATPTQESIGRIPRLVAMLEANPGVRAKVIGHSDPSGDAEADRRLSLARAQYLVGRLEAAGIDKNRLIAEGHGSAEPIADNRTSEGRARNQRVTLVLSRSSGG